MTSRRLVRTIVCAYTRDELPAWWVQVHRRFERAVRRAGLDVRVRLEPLEDLPESFEIIVVAAGLGHRASSVGAGAQVIRVTREGVASAAAELTRELESGVSIYAERAKADGPKVVVHRGSEIL